MAPLTVCCTEPACSAPPCKIVSLDSASPTLVVNDCILLAFVSISANFSEVIKELPSTLSTLLANSEFTPDTWVSV